MKNTQAAIGFDVSIDGGIPERLHFRRVLQGALRAALRDYRSIIYITAAYGAGVPAMLWTRGLLYHYEAPSFSLSLIPVLCGLVPFLYALANRRASAWLAPSRLAAMAIVFVSLPICFASFVGLKRALIELIPYRLDEPFHRADVWLHGGRAPWEWLAPVSTPLTLGAIEFWYLIWYLVQTAFLYYFVWNPSPLSRRFMLTYLLNWIVLGNLVAGALFSVGPCYYHNFVHGEDPYAGLWPLLKNAVPITMELQQQLLHGGAFQKGISAMPSLHVAHAVLIAIACWTSGRPFVRAFGVMFAVLIQIGSVALGWHYAIDGYVGALGTVGLWCAVSWATSERTSRRPVARLIESPAGARVSTE